MGWWGGDECSICGRLDRKSAAGQYRSLRGPRMRACADRVSPRAGREVSGQSGRLVRRRRRADRRHRCLGPRCAPLPLPTADSSAPKPHDTWSLATLLAGKLAGLTALKLWMARWLQMFECSAAVTGTAATPTSNKVRGACGLRPYISWPPDHTPGVAAVTAATGHQRRERAQAYHIDERVELPGSCCAATSGLSYPPLPPVAWLTCGGPAGVSELQTDFVGRQCGLIRARGGHIHVRV